MALGCRQHCGTIVVGTWVDCRRGVRRAGASVNQLALGRRSGWGVLVEHGVKLLVGFCLAIAWVEQRRDVNLDIVWRQCCGSMGSGIWWSETAWFSWLECCRTASKD